MTWHALTIYFLIIYNNNYKVYTALFPVFSVYILHMPTIRIANRCLEGGCCIKSNKLSSLIHELIICDARFSRGFMGSSVNRHPFVVIRRVRMVAHVCPVATVTPAAACLELSAGIVYSSEVACRIHAKMVDSAWMSDSDTLVSVRRCGTE